MALDQAVDQAVAQVANFYLVAAVPTAAHLAAFALQVAVDPEEVANQCASLVPLPALLETLALQDSVDLPTTEAAIYRMPLLPLALLLPASPFHEALQATNAPAQPNGTGPAAVHLAADLAASASQHTMDIVHANAGDHVLPDALSAVFAGSS